jgi:hypothetical protein
MKEATMLKPIILTATALIALFPVAASAGEVENRLHDQQARINQGVANGSLTRGEYDHLEYADDRIQAERNRDLRANGGTLTRGEDVHLNRQENNVSNQIYFDKHNLRRQ